MKVALVCPYSLTLPGGVQGQVLGLAHAMRSAGTEAVVLAPCDDEPPEPGVIPVGRSVPLAGNGSVAPLAPDPAAFLRSVAALRDERPDVVHVHEPLTIGPTWAALLGTRIPAVGTFHASGGAVMTLYRAFMPLARAGARRLAVRTAVSEEVRALCERTLGGTYRVMPNAVDVERFAKADPWPTDERVIFFVGRHEERKGLGALLEAFAGLDTDAVLWVAGEGPQTADLQARDVPRVEWLGRISDRELASRLAASSVFCAPSLGGESFGIVLLEAMAARVPVVASDIAGYRDVARNDREALLVPPGDPDALRQALARVLGDLALCGRLVEAGTERAASFSMATLAERYRVLYDRAIAIARSR